MKNTKSRKVFSYFVFLYEGLFLCLLGNGVAVWFLIRALRLGAARSADGLMMTAICAVLVTMCGISFLAMCIWLDELISAEREKKNVPSVSDRLA